MVVAKAFEDPIRDVSEPGRPSRRLHTGYEHWRNYYDEETLARGDALREVHAIRSAGATIHIDAYPHPEPHAPVVLFNHGAAGYCRHFVRLALSYHDRGYTVVLPDQAGQGLSGGRRGDYSIAEATQNIVDAAPYLEAGRLGLFHWYATEMAARASYYFHLLSKHPTIRVHWIGLDALRDPVGAAQFLGSLGRPAEVTTLRLSEGLTAPASPKDDAEVRALIERLPLQSRRRALGFLNSGRRLGRLPPVRGPSGQASSG